MIYVIEFKNDKDVLHKAIQEIMDNEIIRDFEIVSFDDTKLILNLKNAYLSPYGESILNTSKTTIRMKNLFGKITDKFNDMQEKINKSTDKYESYSTEKLLNMVKYNHFSGPLERAIVMKILKNRAEY